MSVRCAGPRILAGYFAGVLGFSVKSSLPVLVLHGTTGSGKGMLTPAFAGELFGPGRPLDAARYFEIRSATKTGCVRAKRRPRQIPGLRDA